jgi:hypothetical protein
MLPHRDTLIKDKQINPLFMKKNILFALAVSVICFHNLIAQDSTNLSPSVARSFESDFSGATKVKAQSLPKKITLMQFNLNEGSWIAYYDKEGKLITSGRRIKATERLPLVVQESLDAIRAKYERKFGVITVGAPYEMTKGTTTEYFVPMKNDQIDMLVSIDGFGTSLVHNKHINKPTFEPDKSAVAKKN